MLFFLLLIYNVCMAIYIYVPKITDYSGGIKFIIAVAKHLSQNNSVSILGEINNEKIIKECKDNHIALVIPKIPTLLSARPLLFLKLIYQFFIVKRIVKKTDKIISFLFPTNLVSTILSLFCGVPHFHYCFEPYPFLHNKKFISEFPFTKRFQINIYKTLFSYSDIFAVRHAKKIFTLNQITKKMIKKTYGVDAIVTLMGVDTQHFKPTKQNLYRKYAPYVVHSTDYISSKNTDLAIKTISKCDKNIKLLITSTRPTAPEKNNLIELVKKLHLENRVVFLDLVDYEKLPSLYSNALCYLSCSYDEMMGTTSSNLPVKEALACGTPALRANITTEDVEDNKSGFLIDPRKTQSVAKKINYFFTHPEISRKMGKTGRSRIVKKYRWEQVATIIQKEMDLL